MSLVVQEIVALTIVALAALYMVARLTGWPRIGVRRKKACGTPATSGGEPSVILGDRLRRGLAKRR